MPQFYLSWLLPVYFTLHLLTHPSHHITNLSKRFLCRTDIVDNVVAPFHDLIFLMINYRGLRSALVIYPFLFVFVCPWLLGQIKFPMKMDVEQVIYVSLFRNQDWLVSIDGCYGWHYCCPPFLTCRWRQELHLEIRVKTLSQARLLRTNGYSHLSLSQTSCPCEN